MNPYVLLVVLNTIVAGPSNGPGPSGSSLQSVSMQEFTSQAKCEGAKNALIGQGVFAYQMNCVPK